ncbi:MAG: hypothetical protein MZV64_25100 [Ignavibacteriales bacterium]|nr:hypothetical protein [Ignavibacteriales bacterium]
MRRPTGGRAVLHHLEQTYCVLARLGEDPFSTDLQAAYQGICRALVAGLLRLGAPAGLAGAPATGHIKPTEAIPCFIGPASGKWWPTGASSSARRCGGTTARSCSTASPLEDWDGRLQAGCLGLVDDSTLRPAVTTLRELMGSLPDPGALVQALALGFEETFGIDLEPSSLSRTESERAAVLARERYSHERWTVRRERELPVSGVSTTTPIHPGDVDQPGRLAQARRQHRGTQQVGLGRSELQQGVTSRSQEAREVRHEVAQQVGAVRTAGQGEARLVVADLRRQGGERAVRDVGQVGDDEVEAAAQGRRQVGQAPRHPGRQPPRVGACETESDRRNVGGHDARPRQLQRQRHGQAAGAGADVERPRARRKRQPESVLDEQLGLGARDQHAGRDQKLAAEERAAPGDVVRRLTTSPPRHHAPEPCRIGLAHCLVGVGQQPCLGAIQAARQQPTRLPRRFGESLPPRQRRARLRQQLSHRHAQCPKVGTDRPDRASARAACRPGG